MTDSPTTSKQAANWNRGWWILFFVGLLLCTFRIYFPKHERYYALEYTAAKQSIDLGIVPNGRYMLNVAYFTNGRPTGGPESKVEVLDSERRNIHTNIHRNADRQYVFSEFDVPAKAPLNAIVELFEPRQSPDIEMKLWLKEQDRPIYYLTLYSGILLMLASATGMLLARRRSVEKSN